MANCLYPFCTPNKGLMRYFRLPEEEVLRKKWMSMIPQVLNLSKDKISPRSYLCANHFDHDSFIYSEDGNIKSLKLNAVPAKFFVPSTISTTKPNEKDEDADYLMDVEEPPKVSRSTPYVVLLRKLEAEKVHLHKWKEKVKKEEEELLKIEQQLKSVESGERSSEIEEIYQNLLKKMRPIAPKVPQKRKPKTLEEVIVGLRKEYKISDEAGIVLLHLFADVQVDGNSSPPAGKEGLNCFAQVLLFYSFPALESACAMFDVKLPKASLVRSLYNSQRGEPGWNREAFYDLKKESKKQEPDKKLLCSLLVAEINLKKEEEWDGKKMRGSVDYGPLTTNFSFDMDVDGLPSARCALVFMVTPLDQPHCWRVPVAYFFINSLNSSEKANAIRECILRLYSVGAVVLSLTLSVHDCEKSLLSSLGVCFDLLPNFVPFFVHPSDPLLRVHIICDHCTVLSTVQNLWYSKQHFKDFKGRLIEWKYVSELMKIQEAQVESALQSYDGPLWHWEPNFTKNRMIAQLFTDGFADAMEYCWTALNLAQFEDCEGTVEFIRIMGRISQLLNSKKFLKEQADNNASSYLQLLEYLSKLQGPDGNILYVASDGAIHYLYMTLMSCQELLRQVPGFSSNAVSLDHLEVLFYTVKSYIGWDVILTARQFTTAFTSHVRKHGYLSSWTCAQTDPHWWVDYLDVVCARKEGRTAQKPEIPVPSILAGGIPPIIFQQVYPIVEFGTLSAHQYVALIVVKTLAEVLHCDACLLVLQEPFTIDNPLLLLLRKTCGAVICPSRDVLQVCAAAEHHLQIMLKTAESKSKLQIFDWNDKRFITNIGVSVMEDLLHQRSSVFSCLKEHLHECPPGANHLYRLVRGITCCYVRLRLKKFKSWCQT